MATKVSDSVIDSSKSQNLTDAASTSWNIEAGSVANWTIGGNRTLSNPTNIKRGRYAILNITQDSTGGRTVTWSSSYKGLNGGGVPQPNPAASSSTTFVFYSPDGTNLQMIAPNSSFDGQCILAKSGSNLVLSPYNGNLIVINGKCEIIPDAGVSLAATGLSNTTLYYVYVYMSGSTMTLEASTTAYATQAGTGVKIKTGDETRSLVGMCYLQGGAFVDTAPARLVRSWFNDTGISGVNTTASGTTTSASAVEMSSSNRVEFLKWANEVMVASVTGTHRGSSNGAAYAGNVGIDGTATGGAWSGFHENASDYWFGLASTYTSTSLAEGYHYATWIGICVSSIGTYSNPGYLFTTVTTNGIK